MCGLCTQRLFSFSWVRPRSPHYEVVRIQRYGFKIPVGGLKEGINRCFQWELLQWDLSKWLARAELPP